MKKPGGQRRRGGSEKLLKEIGIIVEIAKGLFVGQKEIAE